MLTGARWTGNYGAGFVAFGLILLSRTVLPRVGKAASDNEIFGRCATGDNG